MAAVSLPALPVSPEKGLWLSMPCPIPCKRLITACHRSRCWDSWAEGCGLSMCFCLLEAEDSRESTATGTGFPARGPNLRCLSYSCRTPCFSGNTKADSVKISQEHPPWTTDKSVVLWLKSAGAGGTSPTSAQHYPPCSGEKVLEG